MCKDEIRVQIICQNKCCCLKDITGDRAFIIVTWLTLGLGWLVSAAKEEVAKQTL